jgi:hypothetical protein
MYPMYLNRRKTGRIDLFCNALLMEINIKG